MDKAVRRAIMDTRRDLQAVRQQVALAEQEAAWGDEEGADERPYCELCVYAVGEVDRMLEDKKNEEEIRRALDRICYMLT